MTKETIVPVTAIVAIVILEGLAICNGIDGAALGVVVGVIGGLGGYQLKKLHDRNK